MTNPIPFNPDYMTVKQLKECAELLSLLFTLLDRPEEGRDDLIIGNLEYARTDLARKWGTA